MNIIRAYAVAASHVAKPREERARIELADTMPAPVTICADCGTAYTREQFDALERGSENPPLEYDGVALLIRRCRVCTSSVSIEVDADDEARTGALMADLHGDEDEEFSATGLREMGVKARRGEPW